MNATVSLQERPGGGSGRGGADRGRVERDRVARHAVPGPDARACARCTALPDGVEGVWITDVAAASPLIDEGVQPGDVIVEVNGEPVTSVDEFEAAIGEVESGRFARLYVMRAGGDADPQPFFAVVRVP